MFVIFILSDVFSTAAILVKRNSWQKKYLGPHSSIQVKTSRGADVPADSLEKL